jgi:hypothetical protein
LLRFARNDGQRDSFPKAKIYGLANGFAVDGADPPAPLRRAFGRLGGFISASCDFKTLGAFFCNFVRQAMLANLNIRKIR